MAATWEGRAATASRDHIDEWVDALGSRATRWPQVAEHLRDAVAQAVDVAQLVADVIQQLVAAVAAGYGFASIPIYGQVQLVNKVKDAPAPGSRRPEGHPRLLDLPRRASRTASSWPRTASPPSHSRLRRPSRGERDERAAGGRAPRASRGPRGGTGVTGAGARQRSGPPRIHGGSRPRATWRSAVTRHESTEPDVATEAEEPGLLVHRAGRGRRPGRDVAARQVHVRDRGASRWRRWSRPCRPSSAVWAVMGRAGRSRAPRRRSSGLSLRPWRPSRTWLIMLTTSAFDLGVILVLAPP